MSTMIYRFSRLASTGSGIETAARLGYAAKGVVYATVGLLAILTATGFATGKLTGTRGAVEALQQNTWGPITLVVLATGLIGFTLWRLAQAILDTEDHGSDARGVVRRLGLVISGGMYAWLAYFTIRLIGDTSGSASSTQERAATVMAHDGGQLLVGLVGIGFIAVALYQGWRALSADFKENWKTRQMSATEERAATLISAFGIGSRAFAFLVIGGFLSWAAATADPGKARGLNGALTEIAQNTSGQWLVILTGAGLVSYGLYCFVNALFRRVDVGESGGLGSDHGVAAH